MLGIIVSKTNRGSGSPQAFCFILMKTHKKKSHCVRVALTHFILYRIVTCQIFGIQMNKYVSISCISFCHESLSPFLIISCFHALRINQSHFIVCLLGPTCHHNFFFPPYLILNHVNFTPFIL